MTNYTSDPEVWHTTKRLTFKRLSVILPILDLMVGLILIGLYSQSGSFISIAPYILLLVFVNFSLIKYRETVSIDRRTRKITVVKTIFIPIIRSEYRLEIYDTVTLTREWFSEWRPGTRIEVFGIHISVAGGPRYIALKSGLPDHWSASKRVEELADFFGLKTKDTTI